MTAAIDKAAVREAFAAAAEDYDRAAGLQKEVATDLARRIAQLELGQSPRLLEIGCGTGFLGQALSPLRPQAQWLCTDLAPDMVARTREASQNRGWFVAMDGELPCIAPGSHFDLICSSLAVQWFTNPTASFARLAGLLKPGGYLVFSTLGSGSFHEWRALLAANNLAAGTPEYPDAAGWGAKMPGDGATRIVEENRKVTYADPLHFLRDLKHIGAGTPRRNHQPLNAGQLRRALREIAGPFVATYHVVTIIHRAGA
jgi:malonyl-CoA O-methyltransferase